MAFDYTNYDRLDYIQSNGNQYINTGVAPGTVSSSRGYRYEADVLFPTLPSSAQNYMGVTYNDGSATYGFHLLAKNASNGLRYYFRGAFSSAILTAVVNTKYHCEGRFFSGTGGQELTITDGVNTNSVSTNATSMTMSGSFYLFGINQLGTATRATAMRLYGMKLWRTVDGVESLIRDFVPAKRKSDNMTGLYDVANDNFHSRQGSGQFTYGTILYEPNMTVKKNGDWKDAVPFIKVNGVWQKGKPFIKVNGEWKEGI